MRFLMLVVLFTVSAFAEWPQFRGNPSLTGIATGTLPPENLKLLWTWEGGESFESSPVIAGGVAYIGAGNGDLVAIDMATGKTKWKYKTGAELGESTPAVGSGAVFIGDLRGGFHAVDAERLGELGFAAAQQWTGRFNPRPFDSAAALELYRCAF